MRRSELSWIPNLLTGLNLFLGFWSILQMIEGNYLTACWLIVTASICDGLDGKLARWTRSASPRGLQLDSLADIVSFGAAPGVLLYFISFHKFGLAGVFLAALPLLFGAIRLARFNRHATIAEKKGYVGLPIPMQAITITTFIIFNHALWGRLHLEFLLLPLTFFLAFLMVSHAPYEAMPRITFRDSRKNLLKLITIIAGISLIALNPAAIFFPLLMIYVLKGFAIMLFGLAPSEDDLEPASEEFEEKTIF